MSQNNPSPKSIMYAQKTLTTAQKELVFKSTCQLMAGSLSGNQHFAGHLENLFDQHFSLLEKKFIENCLK
ncbi:hypothetical protein F3J34_08470 [Klebsiella sp. Ap-873]|uniref:hypothetical protein n=1 Tax=Cedecea neteri TaxID=158822 RepID=UPI0012E05F6F|nr:hypothetical protein [Cedecea neteri]NIG73630.1 hypothetical protein [Klebsiella sp. Ap-873]